MADSMTLFPRQLFKDYGENFKKVGHNEAMRILRMRIVARHGHAWFMSNRERIEREAEAIEKRINYANISVGSHEQ